MNTLNEFLDSPLYQTLLKQLQTEDPTLHFVENRSTYGFFLMESFKNFHFTTNGLKGAVPSESQAVNWFIEQLDQEKAAIVDYIHMRFCLNDTLDDHPDGEFAKGEELEEGDRSEVVEILGYAPSAAADFIIEYFLLQYHPNLLVDYFKKSRIPGPVPFARQLKEQFAELQLKNS